MGNDPCFHGVTGDCAWCSQTTAQELRPPAAPATPTPMATPNRYVQLPDLGAFQPPDVVEFEFRRQVLVEAIKAWNGYLDELGG